MDAATPWQSRIIQCLWIVDVPARSYLGCRTQQACIMTYRAARDDILHTTAAGASSRSNYRNCTRCQKVAVYAGPGCCSIHGYNHVADDRTSERRHGCTRSCWMVLWVTGDGAQPVASANLLHLQDCDGSQAACHPPSLRAPSMACGAVQKSNEID